MRLRYRLLPRPRFRVGNQTRAASAMEGLRIAGPLHIGACPPEPRILFVFPDEMRNKANQLFAALKNGVGPFKGTEALFRFRLVGEHVERLPSYSVRGLSDHSAAGAYQQAIEDRLARGNLKADLALIIHRKTERADQPNPYLSSKFPLLRAGIPTQVVTEELLERTETFQWAAANIALAMFAKMGGEPWAVETDLPDDAVIVGTNRVFVGRARHYGFASAFAHNGVYLGTRLFAPARTWETYLVGLREAIHGAIANWREEVGTPVTLVVHARKRLGRDEREVIESCLTGAGVDLIRSWAMLRLAEGEHMALFDPHDEAGTPPAGTMVRLAGHRALLQVAGKDAVAGGLGKVVSASPWHVEHLASSPGSPPFEVLCANIVALSAMNWSGFNTEAAPVTVKYPAQLAKLLGRFHEAGFDIGDLRDEPIFRRLWFI